MRVSWVGWLGVGRGPRRATATVARTRTTAGHEDGAADAVDEGLLVASQFDGLAMARHVVGFTPLATVSRAEFVADLAPVFDHYLTGRLNPA